MIETAYTSATILFVLLGLFFTFVSTVGILRLPDVYSRAHTASQADTLGAGFTLAGVALASGWGTTAVKTVLLLFFIFVTNPTAAHAISRAAHEQGIRPWSTDDDNTDRGLHESARDGRSPATSPTVEGPRPADDGEPEPSTDGGTQPANDGEPEPSTDGGPKLAGDSSHSPTQTEKGGRER